MLVTVDMFVRLIVGCCIRRGTVVMQLPVHLGVVMAVTASGV